MPARRTNNSGSKVVKATVHADKRANIPTEELRDFVAEDERNPVPVTYDHALLYPRDTDADPQLVWRGKDEQDSGPLSIPAVPLYIQEKIDPRALVEDLRKRTAAQAQEEQLGLFADFDGLEGYEQVEFYEHAANWSNRMILGDALLVMNSLAEKERLRGQVQMIYIDPPYGIKFRSNWQVSTRARDVKDGTDASRQPEQVKAFRDTWKDGIHSYLTYLRDRIIVARELLTDSGSIFVQIGDDNVHLIRALLDEVFGPDNFVSQIAVTKSGGGLESTSRIPARLDYLLWYARDASQVKYRPLYETERDRSAGGFTNIMLPSGESRSLTRDELAGRTPLPDGRVFRTESLTKPGPGSRYSIEWEGRTYTSGGRWWGNPKETVDFLLRIGRVIPSGNTLRYIRYEDDIPFSRLSNLWDGIGGASNPIYVVQTNTKIVERCMLMTTDPGDLVLDPTCGSGTTPFVAEHWGRRWVTIDTSRVALALARTRIMSAQYPYFLLADSEAGAAKTLELTGDASGSSTYSCDVRHGFVYKRVPHVSLADIARNDRITPDMSRAEIDRVVAQTAPQETLVDQPFEDAKKIRVSGRFTVESLSPHRNLASDEGPSAQDDVSYVSTILDNLQSAGVQNTFRGERLAFETLEPYPSEDGNLHAHGTITDVDGHIRSVAVSVGPEHGTVSPDMVKDAAREALKGAGFDLLVVCGFAFDAYTPEIAQEFAPSGEGFIAAADERKLGRLRVLLAHMNPDLAMSQELLKKTGTGNLFTVFGEPDVVMTSDQGKVTAEIKGVDVYDPTTGVVRTSSTDDIACWFIDTDYDGEQFFVRHAYFTGANKPYEKLQRALNTDVDAEAWASLYSTTSRPFEAPSTGRIAVKVINHFGDEVLKVYSV